ncbi:FecR domain-containing protein [Candidatus Omnitrophota bacterium]
MKFHINEYILSRHADEELDEKASLRVAEHLSDCSFCRDKLTETKKMNSVFKMAPPIEESENFDFHFKQRLEVALKERERGNIFDELARDASRVIDEILRPKVPVLVRSAVTVIFLFAALFAGLYYTGVGYPSAVDITGDAFIYRPGKGAWEKLNKKDIVRAGDIIRCSQGSQADIALASKYHLRLKENSQIKVAALTPRYRKGRLQLDLANGDLLVDIGRGFTGSEFDIKTASAEIKALGTKFMVFATPLATGEKTWIGVAEGEVAVMATQVPGEAEREGVILSAGMKTEVATGGKTEKALPLTSKEWEMLSEVYMLGKKTRVALFISMNKNRAVQLLEPCAIYITDEKPRKIPRKLEESAVLVREAIREHDPDLHLEAIRKLEEIVKEDPRADYSVQLLLFIGAYYNYIGKTDLSISTFEGIIETYPKSPLIPLAEGALAYIYDEKLGDENKARLMYTDIINKYPDSPEAAFAQDRLERSP